MAAKSGHVEVLEKFWDWSKNQQLIPEELRKQVWLSKDSSGKTAWYNAASVGHVGVLEKLWDFAKELQLKQGELKKHVFVKSRVWTNGLANGSKKRSH